jgi:hypothetical protein
MRANTREPEEGGFKRTRTHVTGCHLELSAPRPTGLRHDFDFITV